jgi:hypothetical protein
MKSVAFEIAKKVINANGDEKVMFACMGTLKEMFIKDGFSSEVANQMAIDFFKITMNAALKCAA